MKPLFSDWQFADSALRDTLETVCHRLAQAGGRPMLVGGCVRDQLLGHSAHDFDLEVFGLSAAQLQAALRHRFSFHLVGQSFAVIKLRGFPIDIALPRRESKQGVGHKGFAVVAVPDLTFAEAACRRDFTVNAIGYDPLAGTFEDPWQGRRDMADGILRHTSSHFSEDPLRVLRAMQFAARFQYRVAPETIELCRTIEPEDLPPERIFDEWRKLLVQGVRPSLGLDFLLACGWLRYFPELQALVGCTQDPAWHPEGDVWRHTLHCLDAFARERLGDPWEDLIVGLGVLCHDLGKPVTTVFQEGHYRSPGHDMAGLVPTRTFLERMTRQVDLIEAVLPLVQAHMRPVELFDVGAGDGAIRRLALLVGRVDRLVRVARADQMGRPPRPFDGFPAGDWLAGRANALAISAQRPTPLIKGRHLVVLGYAPGPAFGPLLEACFEAQLEGVFTDEEQGLRHLQQELRRDCWPLIRAEQ